MKKLWNNNGKKYPHPTTSHLNTKTAVHADDISRWIGLLTYIKNITVEERKTLSKTSREQMKGEQNTYGAAVTARKFLH